MKREKVQLDNADFLKGGRKIKSAVHSPLYFPLHQKEGEGKRKEGGEEREK